ncbi:MAG: Uma2 family endonuclease [Frankia sp.]|nr:Uma2 family endonuclease [Frankia sp.]
MSEPLIAVPPGGWTTDDLDAMPVSNTRYELTDGALSVAPSPSNLHQQVGIHLSVALEALLPEQLSMVFAVDLRFSRQFTRIPDLMIVRSDEPGRHWFAPTEVVVVIEIESPSNNIEDRATKPALYAQFGIPHYWRIEPTVPRVAVYRLGPGGSYLQSPGSDRLAVTEPFAVDLPLVDLLPRWAR